MKDNFGTRMKEYESHEAQRKLIKLLPIYARLDGITFHTFCKGLKKPYDEGLSSLMIELTLELAKEFNANCAYTQSDEISLSWNIDNYESEMFNGGRILKLNSHLASKTSVKFNRMLPDFIPEKAKNEAYFDARVMTLPNVVEATNMFLWRELDATRNSIQTAGQAYFSHKQLYKKNSSDIQEMLFSEKGINWNDYPDFFKRGTYIIRRKTNQPPDLHKIPEQYRWKVVGIVQRNEFVKCDMPPLKKVINRDKVLFFGEEPIISA